MDVYERIRSRTSPETREKVLSDLEDLTQERGWFFKPAYTGRTTFVKFEVEDFYKGNWYSNQRMQVKRQSIHNLQPFSSLYGRKVELNGLIGIIKDCCPHDLPLKGKYKGNNEYHPHPRFANMNNLVMVHWVNGAAYTWQIYDDLKIIEDESD
jgi:hypothetical protein